MTNIIGTIADLKRDVIAGHFFDKGTMSFFKSHVESGIYRTGPRTGYFVTSEQFEDEPREYTVRAYKPEDGVTAGGISTVDEFCGMATRSAARDAARELACKDRAAKTF